MSSAASISSGAGFVSAIRDKEVASAPGSKFAMHESHANYGPLQASTDAHPGPTHTSDTFDGPTYGVMQD